MSYSKPDGKTFTELHDELEAVWHSHYQPGPEYGEHIPFSKMVELFAGDDFYHLHLIAKEFLKIDPEFLQVHLDEKMLC